MVIRFRWAVLVACVMLTGWARAQSTPKAALLALSKQGHTLAMNEPAALSDTDVTQLAPHRPIIEHYRLSPGALRPGSTKTTSQQISRIF